MDRDRTEEAGSRSRLKQLGMSLPEVMVAMLLMLTIVLGLLPIFSQAMVSNKSGRDSSAVSAHARSRAEALFQLPFGAPELTLTGGSSLIAYETYDGTTWASAVDLSSVPANTEWTRTTTIRQYSVADLTTPLASGADSGQVHVKEIEVFIAAPSAGGIFGPSKSLGITLYKAQ